MDSLPLLIDSKRLIWERDEGPHSGGDGKDGEQNCDLHFCSVDLVDIMREGCNVLLGFFLSDRIAFVRSMAARNK